MADGHIIVAAQIDWTGGLVQVTDSTLRIDAALLEDGQFEPRILGGVNWGEAARHPYQSQAGELVVGNLTLANADGGLDALATGDLVGAEVELRRGSDADRWADLEFVFVARVSGVRLNGRSEIVLELENVLADLAGPVFSDKFASTVPNPQLEGKDIPLVLGRVKQAPVLEFNPATLTYYTATNASKIGQVAEGGNPTQRWTLEDQPTFNLLGSPSLPITADFEGPGGIQSNLTDADGNFVTTTYSNVTAPDGSTANVPNGWSAVFEVVFGQNSLCQEVAAGMRITSPGAAAGSSSATINALGGASFNVLDNSEGRTIWTNPQNAIFDVSTVATIDTSGQTVELGVQSFDIRNTSELSVISSVALRVTCRAVTGSPLIERVTIIANGVKKLESQVEAALPASLTGLTIPLPPIHLSFTEEELSNIEVRLKMKDEVSGTAEIAQVLISTNYANGAPLFLSKSSLLEVGKLYNFRCEYETSTQPVALVFGSSAKPVATQSDKRNIYVLDGSGQLSVNFIATSTTFAVAFAYFDVGFQIGETQADQVIKSVSVIDQSVGTTKYASLVDEILTTAGIPLTARDSTSITAHATAAGNPDLGWLVKGDETVDQILFRLAGSLGGYVWHGLDGKVRSKRLALPTDPGGTPFTIDESRADIDEISAFDDPAPQLTTRVNALRNWQPIDPDRQAGITSTWTESDRAAAAADWRITRVYAADADYKRRWAAVESREPHSSALLTGTDAQTLANQAGLWANKPRFYEVPCEVLIGELADVAVGSVVRVELDYPGLDGVWMLVLGREGDARPGTVNLTLWG